MVAVKVAEIVIHALDTFPGDRELAEPAFTLLSLTLKGPKERKVKLYLTQKGITRKCDMYMEMYRNDTNIMNGISQLRMRMPKNINPNPIIIYEEVAKKDEVSDSDSDDDNGPVISANNTVNKDAKLGVTKPASSAIVTNKK